MRPAALALVLLALAACGGGDEGPGQAGYEARMQALPDLFAGEECELPDGVEALEARQEAHRERAAALEEIEPPDEVADAHGKLIDAHREYADALDETIEEVRAVGDPREAQTRDEQAAIVAHQFALAEEREPELPQLAEAQRELGEAGYNLQPLPLDPEAYEARVNEVVAGIDPIAIPDAETMGELQEAAEATGLRLIESTEALEEIVPPRPVAEAHEHLVLGICSRGQELVTFGRFAGVDPDEPADAEGLREVVATLDPFFEEAELDYGEQGYDVSAPEVEGATG